MSKPTINYGKATTALVILFMLAFIAAGWLPRSCPLFARTLNACPKSSEPYVQTPDEIETARVPHISIDPNQMANISGGSEANRQNTLIDFEYRTDFTKTSAYLSIHTSQGDVPLSTITSPLVVSLNWQRIIQGTPDATLYQENPTYASIADFVKNIPPKSLVAADASSARDFGLTAGQYTPLETLPSLSGIQYVLTTYTSAQPDGTWKYFQQTFDLSSYQPVNNKLQFDVQTVSPLGDTAQYLEGTLHLNYGANGY